MLAAAALIGASSPAVAQACTAGAQSDFDGDGKTDLAIGDPDATVGGKARAGRVHIAYNDGAVQTIDGNSIPDNDNGAGERLGFSLATTDWNGDGCTDLFIGAPFENWSNNTIAEAGVVIFVPGSPAGLDTALAKNWSQSSLGVDQDGAADRFGWDIAAGLDKAGDPYLVVGVPGKSSQDSNGAAITGFGHVVYARPGAAVDFNQNSAGVADSVETGDMFGYAVAASPSGFAVGIPGEAAGTLKSAGTVNLFAHSNGTAIPASIAAWGQGTTGIGGQYETSDLYGYSLDMVDYIATGGGAAKMMIAVGTPGESVGKTDSAGTSMALWSPGTGIDQYMDISQNVDKNTGDSSELGDVLGGEVVMVNRTPGVATSADTLLLATGSPGEDASSLTDLGEVGLFSMVEDVAAGGDTVRPALEAAGLSRASGLNIGAVLHSTKDYLWVSVNSSNGGAVYGIPWGNILSGGTAAAKVYTAASLGITSGTVNFGASLA